MRLSRREFVRAGLAAAMFPRYARGSQRTPIHDVPWLAEVQQPPKEPPADAPALSPLLVDEQGRRIETLAAWRPRREALRRQWLEFLHPLETERPGAKFEVLEEDRREGCLRQLIRYESEPGLHVEAYLLRPEKLEGRVPGVVALHSTVAYTIRQPAGLEGKPEDFFGLKLAQRGVVAICPRCFLWQGDGAYLEQVERFRKRRPQSLGMAKMLWDASRAVDLLMALPEVDPQRIGAVGHSLGAKETLYLAAFDERVKVAVSSEGGIGTKHSNWEAPWYLGERVRAKDFAREHHELLALIAPRPFLLLGGDSADGDPSWPFIAQALEVYRLYGDPPRIGLLNHHGGHAVPPEAERRIYEWFSAYL